MDGMHVMIPIGEYNRLIEFEAENKQLKEVLDKIRDEIMDCLKALDDIEKSGLNIYLPNEMTGRRLTYQQCLEFIDKYSAETEPRERGKNEDTLDN